MAGNRANVLRSVHATLEAHAALATALGHTLGATTVAAGARIVGDDIRLDDLPIPFLVLSFAGGDAIAPARELTTWALDATIYAANVYQAAELVDLVEEACQAQRFDANLAQPLNRLVVTGHERLDAVGPAGRLLAVRVNLETTWVP